MFDQKNEPYFVVGEAKSFAEEAIEKSDMDALQAVAKELPGTVLVVSVLKENFSGEEKRLLESLVRWGWVSVEGRMRAPVIMLTGVELFADWTVKESWQKKGAPYPADAPPGIPPEISCSPPHSEFSGTSFASLNVSRRRWCSDLCLVLF